jgi:hypothetical protein
MRPRLTFKIAIILIAVSAGMFMLETLRRHQIASHKVDRVAARNEVRVNTNDFILFETVTKYLFLALAK